MAAKVSCKLLFFACFELMLGGMNEAVSALTAVEEPMASLAIEQVGQTLIFFLVLLFSVTKYLCIIIKAVLSSFKLPNWI